VAAWLIVTGTTQRRLEIGVLVGLWAALIGAFAMFGSRRFMHPPESEPQPQEPAGAELELRTRRFELERAEESAARRSHEARLEQLLRIEIQTAVGREVSSLRAEIAELRSELVEKVGGELRLERIETTRLIGSDLEALQHEVRQLRAVAQDTGDVGPLSRPRVGETGQFRPIVEPARVRPVSREAAEVEADVQPARSGPPETVVRLAPAPTPAEPEQGFRAAPTPPPPVPTPEPAPRATPAPEITGPVRGATAPPRPSPAPDVREARPQPSPAPSAGPAPARDPFASLPRIRPFTDFELDPIEDEAAYTGRRRRTEEEEARGRHSRSEEASRRHRRPEGDSSEDLLARLLDREGSQR
jgi:hypothetical protein